MTVSDISERDGSLQLTRSAQMINTLAATVVSDN
jgi:hypothetical protein